MGLTERHWFENEDVPENYEWALEDAMSNSRTNKKSVEPLNEEPVRVGKKIKAGDVVLDFYQCGHCKNAIRKPWRYCPFCGKAVKWDE